MLRIGGTNLALLARQLTNFAGDLRSVRPALERAVDEVVIPRIQLNIEEDTAAGEDWADIRDITFNMPYRRNHHSNQFGPLLEVGGTLRNAVTAKERWTFTGSGDEAGAFASYPPFVPYAQAQQEGFTSPITGGPVPARPYAVINEQDQDDIEQIFDDWIAEQFGKTVSSGNLTVEQAI